MSPSTALQTATRLKTQVDEEFVKFGRFLASYLTAESKSALGVPFLSLRYEFGAIPTGEDEGLSLNQQKAFLGVAIGLIDSQWRRVNLTLSAKEVLQGWDQPVDHLITQTLSETYGNQDIWNYARFQRFAAPSTPAGIYDEIKAMLLDPRISSKTASLVTDVRAFRHAQEALREEHRMIFEEFAARDEEANESNEENEADDDESDDDEISALLMVDGPKNQPPSSLHPSTSSSRRRSSDALVEEEARAWHEWQQVYVAWDTFADEGADLFDKGQYNLLKLYHHVDILKWFRDVGQHAHPAAALLARIYLGQQASPTPALSPSLTRFMQQEQADWIADAAQRAEKRCILHHNWQHYKQLNATLHPATTGVIDTSSA
ncbi:hypothetical protein BBO99_00000160 [Phytophthora kernoviae]|uniref:HAT C-terminal dimerisation domain-containing protein n=2 Tax=Phytophthora kernoviae TaxID=325452 RepID=A0A3R7KZ86_9STRA|nr:hypothetical protein G195_001403 [Phytophthora kernoviae 00238/432]KAG2531519.1 hypothetical protein JM18_000380 [Phytophthora kernoviae]RLM96824.1 hypothetical protein BBI17_000262 [Phytophthora kernoviae]RLN85851.1 hypothetical protein BBO99_00000160 [Phytophthora kernoviae]